MVMFWISEICGLLRFIKTIKHSFNNKFIKVKNANYLIKLTDFQSEE